MIEQEPRKKKFRLTGRTFFRDLIKYKAETLEEKNFLTYIKDFDRGIDEKYTYLDMHLKSNRLANALLKIGINRGDGVALFQINSPEFLFTVFATMKIGAYTVLVNTGLVGDGLKYIIEHSDAKLLITHWSLLNKYLTIKDQLHQVKTVLVDLNEAPEDFTLSEGILSLKEVMKDASEEDIDIEISMEDLILLMYTAGTTGLPKSITFYQGKMMGNLTLPALKNLANSYFQNDDVIFTCLPLFHTNALFLSSLAAYIIDLPLILSERFSASRHWDICRKYNVTSFNTLGAMITFLMKQPEKPNDKEHNIRFIISAACPKELWVAFEERFNVKITENYGATDGGGFGLYTMGFENPPVGTMGRPLPSVIAEVMDDNGKILPPNTIGELVFAVKPKELESRKVDYYKDPKASENMIQKGADGQLWFHTGDMATKDEEGWFYFQDRKRDSIRRRGENIASVSIENVILKNDKIKECAAYGVESEHGEDEVMVSVVVKPNMTLSPEELLDYCKGKMADFMIPRYINFMEELPKNEVHRVLKRELKKIGVTEETFDSQTNSVNI